MIMVKIRFSQITYVGKRIVYTSTLVRVCINPGLNICNTRIILISAFQSFSNNIYSFRLPLQIKNTHRDSCFALHIQRYVFIFFS